MTRCSALWETLSLWRICFVFQKYLMYSHLSVPIKSNQLSKIMVHLNITQWRFLKHSDQIKQNCETNDNTFHCFLHIVKAQESSTYKPLKKWSSALLMWPIHLACSAHPLKHQYGFIFNVAKKNWDEPSSKCFCSKIVQPVDRAI